MNHDLVIRFNRKLLVTETTEDSTANSRILQINYCHPKQIIVQHVVVNNEFEKEEMKMLRTGITADTLTSVDIRRIVRIAGTVIEIDEGVFYKNNSKHPFSKTVGKLIVFFHETIMKEKGSKILQQMTELFKNCLFGNTISKEIDCKYEFKTER